VVAAGGADTILLGSFVCAGAIVRHIAAANPPLVCIVAMGMRGERPAAEDELCADILAAPARGPAARRAPLLHDLARSDAGADSRKTRRTSPARTSTTACPRHLRLRHAGRYARWLLVATPERRPDD
jgi:phosphosulfolactate phosphohydrolase-like enzyme